MIFQHTWQRVLDGSQTQARHIAGANDIPILNAQNTIDAIVVKGAKRAKWITGNTYSVQPKGGMKGVARIQLMRMWREDVRQITYKDAHAEGYWASEAFLGHWAGMHDKVASRELMRCLDDGGSGVGLDPEFDIKELRWWAKKVLPNRPAHLYTAWVLEFKVVS